ncbi:unnamed protein product [Ilex paraguariensis]|uniref:DUF4220 domain-containing protein n=1 Tax=Ilex paraguariensis TaxID=185542 RepID=A0ABC8UDE6_9AQUA
MLFTAATALIYVERRSLVKVFPDGVKKVWTEWELRVLILLSLTLQVVLILLGNRRKYIPKTRIRVILWCAYLLADWTATVALGVISKDAQQECPKNGANDNSELMAFWAPFLLLHLGGPDTITAYSLEDNELWLRHFVGLMIQTGVAFYIFLMALPGSTWLPILSIAIFGAGLIKYCERTWALMSANPEHLRDSMLTRPDPGPNYAKFMEEFTLKKAEGFHVETDQVIELPVPNDRPYPPGQGKLICEAYDLFQTFKRLFMDLILSFQDQDSSRAYFENLLPKDAFHVVEVELGFAYDVLYTKAPMVYTIGGCILRLVSFFSTFIALVAFVLLSGKHAYHKVDLVITYLLLVVAVLLEIYAFYVMLVSDWTDHWLSKHDRTRDSLISPCLRQRKTKQWWSNLMAQYNLLSVCFEEKPAVCYKIQRILQIDGFREKHRYKTYSKVSPKLKDLIFKHFKQFIVKNSNYDHRALCTHKGSFALRENEDVFRKISWSISEEFDKNVLIWHIATDLCYHLDVHDNPGAVPSNCRESKNISDYMLYLLVMCPYMLPIGIGLIRFRDTCAEAKEFFKERSPTKVGVDACRKLLDVNTEVPPEKVKGDRSKSVLFHACLLAKELRKLEKEKRLDKWELINREWVEMLAYAATHCRGNHHAQQLRKGGELLTHVWLLMAHLGITEQFQISQGHARAKLIVK